ncbi:hypothetical protein [Pelagicoccus mobilis]|uniref:Uncharacterized protein n=1 Tax=Pelagicoccus mobilis TaxID=415221 RepID=A0A934RZE6_9BACT|nr:hypothetical protein [Pelagicoccus mobilis]MBK1878129.1 hypothetical protein [Pelagicoccus mobilis]
MNRFKAITLLLVAAIANPLCCCFGVDAVWEKIVEQPKVEAHSCCSMASSDEAVPVKDRDECPHEVERISKIVDGDTGFQLSKPLLVAVFSLAELTAFADTSSSDCRVLARSPPELWACHAAELGNAYCVYLL